MIVNRPALVGVLLVLACLAWPLAGAQAQEEEAYIQYRQKVMQAQGASMGAIGDILKNKLPYTGHIYAHAQDIQNTSKMIGEAFKKELAAGKTDAKTEIGEKWDKFVGAGEALGQESSKLAEVAQSGNMEAIGAQVKKLGD